jgi:single-stranded DNA-binding protein
MNIAILSGNLGRDSESQTTTKDSVLNFSIGVNVGTKASCRKQCG